MLFCKHAISLTSFTRYDFGRAAKSLICYFSCNIGRKLKNTVNYGLVFLLMILLFPFNFCFSYHAHTHVRARTHTQANKTVVFLGNRFLVNGAQQVQGQVRCTGSCHEAIK